jgi:predicted PurR-regulated permease PerM
MVEDTLRFKREILAVAALLFLGSLFIVYPFLDAILFAIATSYFLRFAHDELNRRLENDLLSTIIIVTSVLGVLSIGMYFFINNFFQILTGLNSLVESVRVATMNVIDFLQLSETFRQNILEFINGLSGMLRSELISIFAEIPSVLVHLGIFMVTSIYLYKDGNKIKNKIYEIVDNLPDEEERIARTLIHSIDYIFRGVFVTQFLVASILGIVAGLGLYAIAQITSPMPLIPIWAFLIGITALLPLIANFMVYAPLGVFYLITGDPLKGSLILIFGITVLQIMPEVFLRPYIGSRQMDEHPLIIFTGFIAGPLTLGLKGIILGPLILILTKDFVLNYTSLVSAEEQ